MFKRKVLYVGGFDPRGVRFYYRLYREAAERWSGLTGGALKVGRRRRVSPVRTDWTVSNEVEGAETEYSFLHWEDIVLKAWIRNPLTLTWRVAKAYWGHLRHLDPKVMKRLPVGPRITLWYPPILTVLLPLLLGLVPFLVALVWLPWWAALAVSAVAGALGARPLLKRAHSGWLLRFFVFNAELAGGEGDPALAARLDAFADEVGAALDGDWDEVLLVTHSNGSILAMPLMTRLLERRASVPERFALVTLGQCIPLVATRRDAVGFREQLRRLSTADFRWVDIGSPPDGAAFHGVDPMPIAGAPPQRNLLQLSPRFHLFYDPATYHKGYANKYEIHFDYLRVGDRPSPLDYPAITAGARPLGESVAAFRLIP